MIRTISRNGHDLYIRPVRDSDTDRLVSFMAGLSLGFRRLFRPHAFTREDALRVTRDSDGGRSTRFVIADPQSEHLVAYGYFSESGVSDPRVPLLGIAVADQYQNQGVGRIFMEALIGEARAQGKTGLQLTVYKENARALHLYGSLGFHVVGDADGGKQHAMRLEFEQTATASERRGVFLNPVPWGLRPLTVDTWTAPQWTAYLDFLRVAGANLLKVLVWPGQYHHPDMPDTLPNAWRYSVLREALTHARGLGMKTWVGFLANGAPPSVWHRHAELRATEMGYRGLGLCWSRGRHEVKRFPAFLMDALADCTDGFVVWTGGPAFCACAECRDYGRVARGAIEEYAGLLRGRAALHVNLGSVDDLETRAGPGVLAEVVDALPPGRAAPLEPGDQRHSARLQDKGIPFKKHDAPAQEDGGADGLAPLPRPRLRQVDCLVAQNEHAEGILGQRITPHTEFVNDFVLLQKMLFPARANHEILRDLGGTLFSETADVFSFARAVWALNTWWETGSLSDLADACEGLEALPEESLGLVRPLREGALILRELVRYLGQGERHFDALVTRVHARMVESPAFQGYTIDHVWQTRARATVAHRVTAWLDALREQLDTPGR